MPDPSLSVRSQEQERQERADNQKGENDFMGLSSSRARRSRTQQPAQEPEDATADEEGEESDEGGAAVLLGPDYLLNRSE